MFVTVPFIFCILGVPKILKWLDDCNHVKLYFLQVSVVNFVDVWMYVCSCYQRLAGETAAGKS